MLLTSRATRPCRSVGENSTVAAVEGAWAVPSSSVATTTTAAASTIGALRRSAALRLPISFVRPD